MVKINVSQFNSLYHFDICGASYVGKPISGTAMYVSKKVESLLRNLEDKENCLVFIETGIVPSEELQKKNCFVMVDNPQLAYAEFMAKFEHELFSEEKRKKYTLTDGGYLVGENVRIGKNAYIEPGCMIGHEVTIGENARILAGAVIKNAVIGDNFVCNEFALIGAKGFTMAEDVGGNKIRIPTVGNVVIGDHVEVGAHDNISSGSAGSTIIDDYVKLDALVHIGHDAHIGANSEITAGCIVGGFDELGEHAYMGINSVSRNRRKLGAYCLVGMGAVVTKDVPAGVTVVGNPAKKFEKP